MRSERDRSDFFFDQVAGRTGSITLGPGGILRADIPAGATLNVVYYNIGVNSTEWSKHSRPRGEKAKMQKGVFTSFIAAAMEEAVVKRLGNGKFFAHIPSCPGVWADGETEKETLVTLQEVLEDWVLFKLRDGDRDFPVLGGADLNQEWKEDLSWLVNADADQQAGTNQTP